MTKDTSTDLSVIYKTDDNNLIEQYIKQADINGRTPGVYRQGIKKYVSWLMETGDDATKRDTVVQYVKYLSTRYAPTTTRTYLRSIQGFYKYLDQIGICENVAKGIKGPKFDDGFRKNALSSGQALDLLSHPRADTNIGLRDRAIISLMLAAGLRVCEVTRLNIGDLQHEEDVDHTMRTVLYVFGKGHAYDPCKADDVNRHPDDYVTLDDDAIGPVYEYLHRCRSSAPFNAPMFTSGSNHRRTSGRLTERSVSRIIKSNMQDIGINSAMYSAHSLRHSAVTFALKGGATLQEAQTFARHKSIAVTLIYAHNIDKLSNNAGHSAYRFMTESRKDRTEDQDRHFDQGDRDTSLRAEDDQHRRP